MLASGERICAAMGFLEAGTPLPWPRSLKHIPYGEFSFPGAAVVDILFAAIKVSPMMPDTVSARSIMLECPLLNKPLPPIRRVFSMLQFASTASSSS